MANELNLYEQPVMTVKQLSQALGVSERTIKDTAKKKGMEISFHPFETAGGTQKMMVFNETQVTAIKLELQNHSKINNLTPKTLLEKQLLIQQAMQLQQEIIDSLNDVVEQQKQQIAEMKPLADGYQTFLATHNSFSMQEASAMLKDKDGKSPYGRNSLIEKLRSENIFLPKPKSAIPYREFIDRGYFEVKTSVHNGISHDSTLVFPKGLDYLAKKLGLIVEYKVVA